MGVADRRISVVRVTAPGFDFELRQTCFQCGHAVGGHGSLEQAQAAQIRMPGQARHPGVSEAATIPKRQGFQLVKFF